MITSLNLSDIQSKEHTNKNTFQYDAYRPLVDCILACTAQGRECVSQHALGRGVCIPACTGQGGVSQHALGRDIKYEILKDKVLNPPGDVCPGDVCPGVSA